MKKIVASLLTAALLFGGFVALNDDQPTQLADGTVVTTDYDPGTGGGS